MSDVPQLSYAGRAPYIETIDGVPRGFDSKEAAEKWKREDRLRKAAPDLLNALDDLWLWASERRTHLDTDPVPDGLGASVLAALAKAEGR